MLVVEHNELTRSSSKFRSDVCFSKLNLNIYAVLNDKGILQTYKKKPQRTIKQFRYLFQSGLVYKIIKVEFICIVKALNGERSHSETLGITFSSINFFQWCTTSVQFSVCSSLQSKHTLPYVQSLILAVQHKHKHTRTHAHVEAIHSVSRLHADCSVQSDDFPVNHGVLRQ